MAESTTSTVVFLDSHPAWRASQRRSLELAAAMRRHPSYQDVPPDRAYRES